MIQELKIKNFLSFKDEIVFSFEANADKNLEDYYIHEPVPGVRLLKLALVYGANASGKSNLINAFGFLRNFVFNIPQSKEVEIDFHPFAFSPEVNPIGEFELVFYVGAIKHVYKLEVAKQYIKSEKLYFYPGTQPAIIFERYFDDNTNTSVIEFGTKLKISNVAKEEISLKTLKNSSVLSTIYYSKIFNQNIKKALDWFEDKFLPVVGSNNHFIDRLQNSFTEEKLKTFVLKMLNKADKSISDITIINKSEPFSEYLLKFMYGKTAKQLKAEYSNEQVEVIKPYTYFQQDVEKDGELVPCQVEKSELSEGLKRYYELMFPLYDCLNNNAFLALDELDTSLHSLLLESLIKEFILQSKSSQLIITIHDISLLNKKELLRKDAIWFTEKRSDQSTRLFSVTDFPKFRKELSYYNYYKSGKFGAIPNID
ncbi:MAG: hypothetical protein DRI86_10850 [Bacteroidetes bacterium]|nr:MAG: hypothetical protein DRI86_10850 [Bacteroidota bacterium]